jgi:hypothetical protein
MTNCKVGDLAIIVKDGGLQENLGITVKIVGHWGDVWCYPYSKRLKRDSKRSRRMYAWDVVALSSVGICYDIYGTTQYRSGGWVPDAYLQPLPKLPADQELVSEESIKSRAVCEAERSDYETQI